MLEGIGRRLITWREWYLTEKILKEFKVPYKQVTLSPQDLLYLQPGAWYQSMSASHGMTVSMRSLSRSSMWDQIGGPQAVISDVKTLEDFYWIREVENQKTHSFDLFAFGQLDNGWINLLAQQRPCEAMVALMDRRTPSPPRQPKWPVLWWRMANDLGDEQWQLATFALKSTLEPKSVDVGDMNAAIDRMRNVR